MQESPHILTQHLSTMWKGSMFSLGLDLKVMVEKLMPYHAAQHQFINAWQTTWQQQLRTTKLSLPTRVRAVTIQMIQTRQSSMIMLKCASISHKAWKGSPNHIGCCVWQRTMYYCRLWFKLLQMSHLNGRDACTLWSMSFSTRSCNMSPNNNRIGKSKLGCA